MKYQEIYIFLYLINIKQVAVAVLDQSRFIYNSAWAEVVTIIK